MKSFLVVVVGAALFWSAPAGGAQVGVNPAPSDPKAPVTSNAPNIAKEADPDFLGHMLGESFQTFATSAVVQPEYRIAQCKQSQTWAGKHRMAAGIVAGLFNSMTESQLEQDVRGPQYTVPDADYSADCATYLYLEKDGNATSEIGCSASGICNGFTGAAAFANGGLEALVVILPQKWDDILVNASQQLGSPTVTAQNGSLHLAGWKTGTYAVAMGEMVTSDLQRVVVVYFATYDRAYKDGVCKTCTPK